MEEKGSFSTWLVAVGERDETLILKEPIQTAKKSEETQ